MVFYDSFWEVAQAMPQESQNDFIACLVRYYFTGEFTADDQFAKIAFASCKPFIDMSKKASKAGKKSAAARSKKSANGSANGSMNGSANKEQNRTQQNSHPLAWVWGVRPLPRPRRFLIWFRFPALATRRRCKRRFPSPPALWACRKSSPGGGTAK